jgi:hypothetical protein
MFYLYVCTLFVYAVHIYLLITLNSGMILQFHVTFSLLGPQIFLSTLFANTLSLYASFSVATKCTQYPVFLIYYTVSMFKTICISSLYVLEILKILIKILSCNRLIYVGSCYLLCMLAVYVFIVSSCVWVHNGVGILRVPHSCYVVSLSCTG